MYKRDVAIILLSCVAILVSLQNEGTFSFHKAWYHHTVDESQELYVQHHELPPALVADLNGDGHLEVVLATPDLKVQVVQPHAAGRQGEGFAKAKAINEVSLLFKNVLVTARRRPVALSVGSIDPMPHERVRPLRKQVVVVVTAAWQVLCLDHNLKLMWEYDAKEHFPPHAHIKEVAVYVSAHQVQGGDRGLVVVGASVARGDLLSGQGMETEDGATLFGSFSDDDVLKREMREEQEEGSHSRTAGSQAKLSDLDASDPVKGLDTSRHFSYVALEGGSGALRWHHTSKDFHKDLGELGEQMTPQNNYRLEAEKLEGRHFGEASCRDYRESLLHVLPHVWDRPADTRLAEAHFVKHKQGRGAQKAALAGKGAPKGAGARHGLHHPPASSGGKDGVGMLLDLFGSAAKRRLQQGGTSPGRGGAHMHTTASRHHNHTANALVAYLEDGIEVLHLFTGRTLCKLHLPSHTLHADLNGDGVLDHVSVYHGRATDPAEDLPGEVHNAGSARHHQAGHCSAVALSGIPPREHLFQMSVCKTRKFGVAGGVFQRAQQAAQPSELATPIMLPLPDLDRGYRSHRKQHGMVVFLTNKGEMTAASAKGEHLWQGYMPVSWPPGGEDSHHVVPTLAAMAMRVHAVPTVILAAGSHGAAIVSEHGHILETLTFPFPPIQPLVVADFNGDGLNDIILVTSGGVYGYAQVPHMGGFSLSALLLALIAALGIVYYTQQGDGTGGRQAKKARSTDYTD